MGALHEGHISLVRRAFVECDIVIVSIFVNPSQFDRDDDLQKYPRDKKGDLSKLKGLAHIVFIPGIHDVYGKDHDTWVSPGELSEPLCGASRKGHFRGVATVCMKLFNMVQPDVVYLGEKDWQQLTIIRRMVRDFSMDLDIIGCSIIREVDGLAMSSRNLRLSPENRQKAPSIYKALSFIADEIRLIGNKESDSGKHPIKGLRRELITLLEDIPGAKIDYAEILDPETLKTELVHGALIAVAVFLDDIRLIDNIVVRWP